MTGSLGSLGPKEVKALRKKLSDGEFRPHLKRCLLVPAPCVDLGVTIIHTRRRKTIFKDGYDGHLYSPNMGIFNLYFLMSWVEDSLGMRVEKMKPIHPGGKPAVGEKMILNVPMDRNPEMFGQLYDLYNSDAQATIPNQAPLWKCSKFPGQHPYDYIVFKNGFVNGIALPEYTGYWKIVFDVCHLFAGLVNLYLDELRVKGYSYRFESSRLTLYFANSIGASLGLPPTPKHLDLPNLVMNETSPRSLLCTMITSVDNWESERYDEEEDGGIEWELLSNYQESEEGDDTPALPELEIGEDGEKIDSIDVSC